MAKQHSVSYHCLQTVQLHHTTSMLDLQHQRVAVNLTNAKCVTTATPYQSSRGLESSRGHCIALAGVRSSAKLPDLQLNVYWLQTLMKRQCLPSALGHRHNTAQSA